MVIPNIKMEEIAKNLILNVRIINTNQFQVKIWFAKQLIKLAAYISGMGIKFEKWPYEKTDI